MFGKWERGTSLGCEDLPVIQNHPPKFQVTSTLTENTKEKEHLEMKEDKIEIGADGRPTLEVMLCGVKRRGLLDSGATLTIKRLCPLIEERRADIKKKFVNIRAANGGSLEVLGVMRLPYECDGRKIIHETYIVKEMLHDLILGVDFWKVAGLTIRVEEVLEMGEGRVDYSCEMALEGEDKRALEGILRTFLMTTEGFLGRTNLIEHVIETIPGAREFISRPHAYSPEMEKRMGKEIDEMLARDIIAPSKSPVCSTIVPVKKQDGSIRLCLDSRKLNEITVKDKFPMPSIPHLLSRIQKVRYISSLDLSKAFWQIPLSSEKRRGQMASSQELTAFAVKGRGLYHFKVMPFGLTNSPATQCRLMHQVLGYDLEPNLFVYIDDILLLAETVTQMLNLLREVAKRLRKANLSINLKKSVFFAKEVKYVGYILSSKGIAADPEKVEVMREYPKPKNVKAMRRFLGMAGYYRRLIRDFSGIAAPLTDMLKQSNGKFFWDEEREKAFRRLKEALTLAPVVATPDFSQEFVLQCDASDEAAGAALGQIQEGKEVVIAYYSHKWGKHEKNWGPTEKEAGSVLFSIKHFRSYLWGRPFTVVTDAMALTHIRTIQTDGSSRLSRWAMELNSYQLTIKHRAGRLQVVPDAISRAVEALELGEEWDDFQREMMRKIERHPEEFAHYRVEGSKLLRYEKCEDDIGCYDFRWKQYVPEAGRGELISRWHEKLAHQGPKKCAEFLRRAYFWPEMKRTVKEQLRSCQVCKAAKSRSMLTHVPLGKSRNADFPFQKIALDHWGPVPRSRRGNSYLLVVVDIFSKFVLLNPTPNAKAIHVVKFLEEEVFLKFNVPQTVITDNHRPLIGNRMQELLARYDVEHWTIGFYHSQANPAERYVRTVSEAIRSLVIERHGDQRQWDTEVAQIQWALNTTKNDTTRKSPFLINFGREALASGGDYDRVATTRSREEMTETEIVGKFREMREQVKEHTSRAQDKFRAQYNKKTKPELFSVGERVWRRNRELSRAIDHVTAKLTPKFVPCVVVRVLGPETYEIREELGNRVAKMHANDLIKDN